MSAETEEIKRKLDIVEVVGEYVRLNPAGGPSFKGLCPFHAEKTPSFFVHGGEKQFWHCFGCSEGGDVFDFWQRIENVDFPEALRDLARKAGVELPQFEPKAESERAKLLDVLEDATKFFEAALKHPTGERARAYLAKRKITDATVAEFRLGYAPATWESLVAGLAKHGHAAEHMVAAGLALASDKGRGHYDRFRDRIMIPLRDERGRVVGFTGRILPDAPDADKTGKYVNTPETMVYHKRKLVFALDRGKDQIKKADFAVLVEGNMDAVSSHQAGVKNVVAVSGTAFSTEQIDLLKRYTTRIALAFDADAAGQAAIAKALPHAWRSGMQVMVVTLPEGFKDPDDVIAKDPALWKKAIVEAKDMIAHSVERAVAGIRPSDPFAKRKALESLKPVFAMIDEPVLRDHWVHAVSERLQLGEEAVRKTLGSAATPQTSELKPQTSPPPHIESRDEKLAERLLSLLLNGPELWITHVPALQEGWFPEGRLRGLVKELKAYYTAHATSAREPQGFFSALENARQSDQDLPSIEPILLLRERDMAGWTDEQLKEEAAACARELEKSARKRAIKDLLGALGDAERRGDREAATSIAQRLEELVKPV